MSSIATVKNTFRLMIAILAITVAGNAFAVTAPSSSVPFETALKEATWLTSLYKDWSIYRGEGESMYPHYGSHSLLIVNETSIDRVKSGMIVLFEDADGDRVAHIVDRTAGNKLYTRGANNSVADPAPVTEGNFIGVIIGIMHTDRNSMADATVPVAIGKTY